MLSLKKVAVTGGVASGKSTVCHMFEELGAWVVDADALAHQLLDPKTPLGKEILHLLGPDVLVEGAFDRTRIAKKVFHDPQLLTSFEALIHPPLLAEIEGRYRSMCKAGKKALFVVEVPLLFEVGWDRFFDASIAVVSPLELAKRRFAKGDFEGRMKRHFPVDVKRKKANYVLENSGSLSQLKKEVETLNQTLL